MEKHGYSFFCYRSVNGSRVRVEHSTGKVRPKPWLRGGRSGRGRRPFHPEDRCYECGEAGHYAYDCPRYRRGGRRYSEFNLIGCFSHFTSTGSFCTSSVTFGSNY